LAKKSRAKLRVFGDSAKLNKSMLLKTQSKTVHFRQYTTYSEKSGINNFWRLREVNLSVYAKNAHRNGVFLVATRYSLKSDYVGEFKI
jgi:hypothetical protein